MGIEDRGIWSVRHLFIITSSINRYIHICTLTHIHTYTLQPPKPPQTSPHYHLHTHISIAKHSTQHSPQQTPVPAIVKVKVTELGETIGFDYDTLSYVLGMLICYPLGIIMASLPYGKTKHLFSFLLGAFLLQFTLGVQVRGEI